MPSPYLLRARLSSAVKTNIQFHKLHLIEPATIFLPIKAYSEIMFAFAFAFAFGFNLNFNTERTFECC
jgi:hypothetical protein